MKVNAAITPAELVRKIERFWEWSARKILAIENDFDAAKGAPGLYRRGPLHRPRLDRMDAGLPVRLGDPAVRRHRRRRVLGDRPPPDAGRDGSARRPFRRARPRLQQRQHLRQPAAADGRGEDSSRPVGAALLRAGPEAQRRGAGPALVENQRRRRLHLFVQRPAFAVCRHDPLAPRAGPRPPTRPRVAGRRTIGGSRCWIGCTPTPTATAKYLVYYGEGRDAYDVRGRVAHEAIFNVNDGRFRCPNSQQGYSPFSTWTRGLAWAMCGFAEQLEFLAALPATGRQG